jgi:type I restriction enzyme M protein
LKEKLLKLQADINRLTFDLAVDPVSDGKSAADLSSCQQLLSTLESQISAPQSELDRLTRQFWVDGSQVRLNKYDLSASRYRQAEDDETYHEAPQVTMDRLSRLEQVIQDELDQIRDLLK